MTLTLLLDLDDTLLDTKLTSALPFSVWREPPGPGGWCLTETICYLRDVEREVNRPRLRKVLAEDNPFIAGEVTDRWAEERQYAKQDDRLALADFTAARKETLSLLEGLQTEWSRLSRHSVFGSTNLQELAAFATEHDRACIQQVWKIIHGTPKDGQFIQNVVN